MSSQVLDDLFTPPKLETGDRVTFQNGGILGRKRGTVISSGGWFAVIQWDQDPRSRREYIPDLAIEDA
jgi:hypothetical protein